jgi:hypothetical protein
MARRLRTDCDDLTPGETFQAAHDRAQEARVLAVKWRAIAQRRFEVSESERQELSEWTIALCGAGKEIFEWMGEIWLEMAAKWDRMAELAELNFGGESTIASSEEGVHIASVQIPALQGELKQAMECMDDASALAKTTLDKAIRTKHNWDLARLGHERAECFPFDARAIAFGARFARQRIAVRARRAQASAHRCQSRAQRRAVDENPVSVVFAILAGFHEPLQSVGGLAPADSAPSPVHQWFGRRFCRRDRRVPCGLAATPP